MGKKMDFDKIIKALGLDKPAAMKRFNKNMRKLIKGC